MEFLCENSLLITSNARRKTFIKEFSSCLKNVSYLTDKEFYNSSFFKINEKSITKIMELHPEISFFEAKKIYDVLPFYNECFNELKDIKVYFDELKSLGLITKKEYFHEFLKSKKVFIDDDIFSSVMDYFLKNNSINFEIVKITGDKNKNEDVVEFKNAFEECCYVINEICKLIEDGNDINKIHIYGISDEYRYYLEYLKRYFGIDFDYLYSKSAIIDEFGKEFLNLLKDNDVLKTYELLSDKYKESSDLKNVYFIANHLKKFENKALEFDVQQDVFREALKEISFVTLHKKNAVKVIDEFIFDSDSLVFVMNFNQDVYPRTIKNSSFLDDEILEKIHALNSKEKNAIEKKLTINFLKGKNIKLITRKRSGIDGNNYVPSILSDLKLSINRPDIKEYQFSKDALELTLSSFEDYKQKYNFINPDYYALSNVIDINFKEYDNCFKGVVNIIKKDDLCLSYSSADDYFSCPFKYYLKNFLFSYDFETTFDTELGTLIHGVLEDSLKNDFDFEKSFCEHTKKIEISPKKEVFLRRIKDDTRLLVNFISQNDDSIIGLERRYGEKSIKIKLDNNVYLTGKIDKFLVLDNGKDKCLSVVDYKSSDRSFDSKQLIYGKGMQLPTYLLLLNNSEEFKEYKLLGAFYETIMAEKYSIPNEDHISDYYSKYCLKGMVLSDADLVGSFYKRTVPYKYIKGLYSKKDESIGIKGTSFSKTDFESFEKMVRENYLKMAEEIKKNIFDIKPIQIGHSDSSCKYCKFKSVCYVKTVDINHIDLVGEENGEN